MAEEQTSPGSFLQKKHDGNTGKNLSAIIFVRNLEISQDLQQLEGAFIHWPNELGPIQLAQSQL